MFSACRLILSLSCNHSYPFRNSMPLGRPHRALLINCLLTRTSPALTPSTTSSFHCHFHPDHVLVLCRAKGSTIKGSTGRFLEGEGTACCAQKSPWNRLPWSHVFHLSRCTRPGISFADFALTWLPGLTRHTDHCSYSLTYYRGRTRRRQ